MPNALIDLNDYSQKIVEAMSEIYPDLEKVYAVILDAVRAKKRIWIIGNGGSLAIAQHFAQDLLKLCGVKAQAINCPSIITAYSNDDGFEYSYFSPISVLAEKDDVILIFSCSGNSRNYIEFISGFTGRHFTVISVIGKDGGFLREKSNLSIHIKSDDYQVCETAFCVVADVLVKSLLSEGNL